ncbi:hypothetical protein A2G96_28600 [Cupriavidus nantongensis]|uniref:Uncharacterized protein n=1 Tax=Cupriavidus nantongensis TaxID=1796606 RepID=A0A142JUG5_9BURK|nr:hypothetical protein A2G96_28600 [Cupriavidus nantongensis]
MRQVGRGQRLVVERGRVELGHQHAGTQDADAVGQLPGIEQVMRGHQHRHAGIGSSAHAARHVVGGGRVQPRSRFVEQQQRRRPGLCDRQPDLLPHALRIAAHAPALRLVRQASAVQQRGGVGARQRNPRHRAEIVQVLHAGQIGVQRDILRQVGHAPPDRHRIVRRRQPVHAHHAAGRRDKAQDRVDGGGLARAVAAQQGIDAARGHAKLQAVDHATAVAQDHQVTDFKHLVSPSGS